MGERGVTMTTRRNLLILLILMAVVAIGTWIKGSNPGSDASPTAIAAVEKERGSGFVSYMIHEHSVPGGEVAFYIRKESKDQIGIAADFVRKSSKGWSWGYG